jgi:hypothetical protein
MKFKNLALFASCFLLFNSGVSANPPGGANLYISVERNELFAKQRIAGDLFGQMLTALEEYFALKLHKGIVNFAQNILAVGKSGLRIDRTALRHKSGIVCWLCENFPGITVGDFPPMKPGYSLPDQAPEEGRFRLQYRVVFPVPRIFAPLPVPQAPADDSLPDQAPRTSLWRVFGSLFGSLFG